ncbi:hypothetical protein CAEBREN_18293 [Caenorhabditis brenneri]|uniref:Uncharacterized protein n=1 Tax=Caenorhabditis brenneri TaxID=135651 RepID=G0NMX8_CAEBE|nr:hypothetical protein CAEBREN_18293 [Caenorhabditis brenneri]
MNSTRNLSADEFQKVTATIICFLSFLINLLGNYVAISSTNCKSKYEHLSYHFVLFLSQFYFGVVLNTVILAPVPGLYCIGWVKNSSDVMKVFHIALCLSIFQFQGEFKAILIFLKINQVARSVSFFKLFPVHQLFFISLFLFLNHFFLFILFPFSYSTSSEVTKFILEKYPDYAFVIRYQFVWMVMPKNLMFLIEIVTLCSVGLTILAIFFCYITVLYELERRKNELSKSEYKKGKEYIDEIASHGTFIFPFFSIVPVTWFLQFFVREDTDVSYLVAIVFIIFISTPIFAMISFLWRNQIYRAKLLSILLVGRQNNIEPRNVVTVRSITQI